MITLTLRGHFRKCAELRMGSISFETPDFQIRDTSLINGHFLGGRIVLHAITWRAMSVRPYRVIGAKGVLNVGVVTEGRRVGVAHLAPGPYTRPLFSSN
jgi:hypothetical protein